MPELFLIKKAIRHFLTAGLFLIFILLSQLNVYANDPAQDITLISSNSAIASLKEPVTAAIVTQNGEKAVLEVNDMIVEADRVLIRVLIWDLSPQWADKIDDPARIYGSYLPVAELGIPTGKWLTPSSGSKYSLISNGNQVIIAGLLEFLTAGKPETMAFNFNQIPFDVNPLAEGAALVLNTVSGDNVERKDNLPLSNIRGGIGFHLMNIAQSPKVSMIQPAFSLANENETLSRTGWISVQTSDGKTVPIRRTDPYGVNLSDDRNFILRNGYLMPGIHQSSPLTVTLNDVYLNRKSSGQVTIDFGKQISGDESGSLDLSVPLDEFQVRISGYQFYAETVEMHTHTVLRLFLAADPALPQAVSGIYFTSSATSDTARCGFLPDTRQFACDLTLESLNFESITLSWDSFEYRVDDTWTIQWNPAAMIRFETSKPADPIQIPLQAEKEPPALTPGEQDLLTAMKKMTASLIQGEGWIHEKTQVYNAIPNAAHPELLLHGMEDSRRSRSLVDTWTRVNAEGSEIERLTVTGDADGMISEVIWTTPEQTILLPHGLVISASKSDSTAVYPYLYGAEFYSLFDSSAEVTSIADCDLNGKAAKCYEFTHSLYENAISGMNDFSNKYQYWIDQESGQILQKEVSCQLDGPGTANVVCVTNTTLALEKTDSLPEDLQNMLDKVASDGDL